eukprot:gene18266-biopygen21936
MHSQGDSCEETPGNAGQTALWERPRPRAGGTASSAMVRSTLGDSEPLWAKSEHSGCALGRSGPLWVRSGPLWTALGRSGPLWAASDVVAT